ncbi:MAG: EamA family transporter RarD [Leptothrix sp. (in: Bacteria)]|nr:EamA family transporter RarD [Leptothrix sp. (in: b-proteobacteria)]
MNTGLVYALLAFGTWGLFPLYFIAIATVPPLEVVLHRSLWALLLVLGVLAWQRRWAWLGQTLRRPRHLALFAISALLLACNWLIYVMAVQTGHVADASLGYFINPLVNVLLGVLVLRERLRSLQWLAVAVAAAGVAWLTWHAGRLPWIALVLAGSFGLYGLMRKTAPLGALEGLALENLLLAPIVVPALLWWSFTHDGVLVAGPPSQIGWLLLSGPLTALPLLWFAGAARRLELSTLGMVQYLGPSLQLLLAVWVFNEPFDGLRLIGFALIWSALALVTLDALGWRPPALRRASGAPGG